MFQNVKSTLYQIAKVNSSCHMSIRLRSCFIARGELFLGVLYDPLTWQTGREHAKALSSQNCSANNG